MSEKMNFIPFIKGYDYIKKEMYKDLQYRLNCRQEKTFLGRPLYFNINVQMVITKKCNYNCPFCIEQKNNIGTNKENFEQQLISLKKVLNEHKNARLTITGGEPSLFINHCKNIVDIYNKYSNGKFININTTGFDEKIADLGNINLSVNEYIPNKLDKFPNATYQTVLEDDKMNVVNIKEIMDNINNKNFSFRFISEYDYAKDYNIAIFNELANDKEFKINTFRIGDFFVYATFNYKEKHGRITLGDMYIQKINDYKDGYSNIIIHPNGSINVNWR